MLAGCVSCCWRLTSPSWSRRTPRWPCTASRGQEQGRSGSLRAAYSCEEELLPRSRGEERRRGGGEEERRRLRGEEERVLPSSSGCSSEGSEYQTSSLRSQGPAYRPPRIRSNCRTVDWRL